MSGGRTGHSPVFHFGNTPKPAQTRREISAIKNAGQKITRSKATARKFLQEHGFITKDGKISKHYR